MNYNHFTKICLVLLTLHSLSARALSPQERCEVLEAKSPNSFEMLNMELEGGAPSITSVAKVVTGNYLDSNLGLTAISGSPGVWSSGYPASSVNGFLSLTACDNTYKFYPGLAYMAVGGATLFTGIAGSYPKLEVTIGSEYPACAVNGTGVQCSGSSCFPPGPISVGGQTFTQHALYDTLNIPQAPLQINCNGRSGIQFKNGNSCIVSNVKIRTVGSHPQYALEFSMTETRSNSASIVKVKYCSRGMFYFATIRTGPVEQKHDSLITCIAGNGQSSPGVFSTLPLQGDLTANVKHWLVDMGGCTHGPSGNAADTNH